MDCVAAEHEKICLKLIELVKARELLYKNNSNNCSNSRLWAELGMEMNKIFGMNHHMEHWRNRWRTLRSVYRGVIQSGKMKDSAVLHAMEFLRPSIRVSQIKKERNDFEKIATGQILVTTATTNAPYQLNREPLVNNLLYNQENVSFVLEDSNSDSRPMLNDGEIVTPIITSFEIYFENDNDTLANNELPKAKANHSTGVQSGKESGSVNPIAMELFSPYADFEAIPIEKIRNNSESMAPSEIPATTATTKTPNQINRDQVNDIGDHENITIVIADSDSESSCQMMNGEETVEPTDTTFEKYSKTLGKDDDNDVLCMASTNNLTGVSFNAGSDAAFLTLIAKELPKMAPSTRKQFKRNVLQLLYS